METFTVGILKTVKDIIVGGFKFAIAGVLLIVVTIVAVVVTMNWPFYSYAQLHSFVSEVQKDYPVEANMLSNAKAESDNFSLTMGKLYCGLKLINLHIPLIDTSNDGMDAKQQKFTASVYRNADQYLCPRTTAVLGAK